ncbi:hypothetical protein CANARDRAFT_27878 [[Candida] arabinofermentans NRRL YB-2248]|uniref:Uncharacterized protein n=1 Tax=[Candida] arabinofermentans NRRL YB-2248 TaxID=983967 RepID=A0A1E4T208_9ASCO|nr:hypothetical protein CANARDRAFT_27878 [[Candida] arabinofermentans NRRL YB-2248]
MSDLHAGYFNNVKIPFKIINHTPLFAYDVPYDMLIQGYSIKEIVGREISPPMLNLNTRWPANFQNPSMYDVTSTYNFHCSLTPIVSYESPESVNTYHKNFLTMFEELKSQKKNTSINLDFKKNIDIFTKVNYSKFFMVLPVSDNTRLELDDLYIKSNEIRFQNEADIGSVLGEEDEPVKHLEGLHVTGGICGIGYKEDLNHLFGMYELFYMNEVLLKPKQELLEKYGGDASNNGLKHISDVQLQLTDKEIEMLTFVSSDVVLNISGAQLIYKL